MVEVIDEWLIESSEDGGSSLKVSAELTALDGRRCWLAGSVTRERRGYAAQIRAPDEGSAQCSAILVPTESGLMLSASDAACSRVLCAGEGPLAALVLDRTNP